MEKIRNSVVLTTIIFDISLNHYLNQGSKNLETRLTHVGNKEGIDES